MTKKSKRKVTKKKAAKKPRKSRKPKKIASLLPIGEDERSSEVCEALSSWLFTLVMTQKKVTYDTSAIWDAALLIRAFAALEKEGTVAAFKGVLDKRVWK